MNEDLMTRRLGSSRYCRICNGYHSCCFHRCGNPSPLQIAQMKIEDLENFFASLPILADKRTEAEKMIKKLREVLNIPQEKIYARRVTANEEILMEEFEKAFAELKNIENVPTSKGKKETASSLQYNPSTEILERAKNYFEEIYKTIKNFSCMTKCQLESFERITDEIRTKVLKETL